MDDLDRFLEEQMRDPEFAKEYKRLEPEYQLKSALIGARIKAEMTQEELAKRCGLRASNISRIESGRSVPSVRTLWKIAKGLGRKLKIEFV
ncbi:helix-turn-helix transcriptional regulator [Bifidobacterium sp. ESL0775]|uniref:helix-turn-helix domain-containing protein n=1 Tax=Bifidobacterium sp. ESL0775 TaxID=2983230 RepID=UPI0023FA0C7A|nr:helix-turn-helix transcriptional regulator [Bifidobacterium sp. ESL0775]WEV69601.1 helix-turn-helix transcriptional regulator [Bifidobacterium sp. ESL0775]